MTKDLNLGAAEEAAVEDLLTAFAVGRGLEVCFLASAHRASLDEARRRLADAAGSIHDVDPTADIHEAILEAARRVSSSGGPGPRRPAVWVGTSVRCSSPKWAAALGSLNQHREWLRANAPVFLVVAGTTEMLALAQVSSPDLWSIGSITRILKTVPRLGPRARVVRWLHVSDFHFEATERWERRVVLESLLRDVVDRLPADGLRPDLVLVTGDVAYSGKRAEYHVAQRFFDAMAKRLGLDPRVHWFIVPGNHDVDRDRLGPADGAILDSLVDQGRIKAILADPRTMRLLSHRLQAFYDFTSSFLGTARGWDPDRPWRSDTVDLDGLSVGVLQLNSTWAGGTTMDRGRLIVGEHQVREALAATADAYLRVALLHHPSDWLRECEGRTWDILKAPEGADFVARGHLHEARATLETTPDHSVAILAAGAAYQDTKWPIACLLTEVDPGQGEARVHMFRFSGEGRGFWTRDNGSYETAVDGRVRLPLPAHLRAGEALEVEATVPADGKRARDRESHLVSRYRAAAARVLGTSRFLGLADHQEKPNAWLPDLYVPAKLRPRGAPGGESAPLAPDWIARRLLGLEGARAVRAGPRPRRKKRVDPCSSRIAVLGGPGTGKTALCHYLAVLLAGGTEVEGVEVPGHCVPLLLRYREYARSAPGTGEQAIVSFLEHQIRDGLSLAIPDGFIADMLESGRAILLVDGLDEVGSPERRTTERDRVLGLCQAYPRASILVTSRIAGYDEAPMPATGPGAFDHLEIQPFDDRDLDAFVRRWYAYQEPHDPVERDRGIARLAGAIDAEPRIRELARNPLLATLIALIHRFEARLPGERAKLLELCVRTLLETWPSARGRRFGEIDEALQREYLQQLALRMQESRNDPATGVLIRRAELQQRLLEVLRRRDRQAEPEDHTKKLVERWIDYLEEGTGLLVEQSPGEFGFFHLSLMEYLAACALARENTGNLPRVIADRHWQPPWEEVCLLAVGSHAEDASFLDEFVSLVEGEDTLPGDVTLLRCLREEAALTSAQRDRLLERLAGRRIGEGGREYLVFASDLIEQVMRFSHRHHAGVRSWFDARLGTSLAADLRGVAALRVLADDAGLLHRVQARPDARAAARWLLDFAPLTQTGAWAATVVDAADLLDWGRTLETERTLPRAVLQLLDDGSLWSWAPLTLAVCHRALEGAACLSPAGAGHMGRAGRRVLRVNVGGHGVRLTLCSSLPVATVPDDGARWHSLEPSSSGWLEDVQRIRFLTPPTMTVVENASDVFFILCDLQRAALVAHAHAASLGKQRTGSAEIYGFWLETQMVPPSVSFLAASLPWSVSQSREGAQIAREASHALEEALRILTLSNREPPGQEPLPPDATTASPDQMSPRWLVDQPLPSSEPVNAFLACVCEAELAFHSLLGCPAPRVAEGILHRLQNRVLVQRWLHLEHGLPRALEPDRLALYLALGWGQFSTTGYWPATPRWRSIMAARPEAWLARLQWHLCWLCHDPASEGHRSGRDEALALGRKDADRPGYAEAFETLLLSGAGTR